VADFPVVDLDVLGQQFVKADRHARVVEDLTKVTSERDELRRVLTLVRHGFTIACAEMDDALVGDAGIVGMPATALTPPRYVMKSATCPVHGVTDPDAVRCCVQQVITAVRRQAL
jgi:hypothetical protein